MKRASRSEWDFSSVVNSELFGCRFYEYARESEKIRKLTEPIDAPEPTIEEHQRNKVIYETVGADSSRHDAASHLAAAICRLPEIEGWPDIPWQKLPSSVRELAVDWLPQFHPEPPVRAMTLRELRDALVSNGISEIGKIERENYPNPVEIQSFASMLHLDWVGYSDSELIDALRCWIAKNRPAESPEPPRRGRGEGKSSDVLAHLRRLGIFRIMKICELSSLDEDWPEAAEWVLDQYNPGETEAASIEAFGDRISRDKKKAEMHLSKLFPL